VDSLFQVALGPSARGRRVALLKELSGLDELGAIGVGPVAATELLERLLVEAPGPVLGKAELWELPLGERDQLLARLHARHIGDRIESFVPCATCHEAFALEFSLDTLVTSLSESTGGERPVGPDDAGSYVFADGRRFRPPSANDERCVRALPAREATDELLRRCLLATGSSGAIDWIHDAMTTVAPIVDLEFPVSCALCGREQTAHFDIVSFFLGSLARERTLLLREVHRLASAYHWGRDEILRLPRSERRAYVALLEAERRRVRVAS
jgi:hypothetical protein